MRGTKENLRNHAAKPLAQWLIHAAKRRTLMTYVEAKHRLEAEVDFDTIFSPMMGVPAGELMYRILAVQPDCPPINILLVRQGDRMPGDGAASFMADYLGDDSLRAPDFRETNTDDWRLACYHIASDVYAFGDWDGVYRRAFLQRLPAFAPPKGREKDGIRHHRKGEGPNHKALRLWVKDNPGAIRRTYAAFATETEVVLDSADRVDVVYRGPRSTVAIEVKSSNSDYADLRRGVFQCIKYRAVMEAMDLRADPEIIAILVTQTRLTGDLKDLLRQHGIRHFMAPTP